MVAIGEADLAELEATVQGALRSGDETPLRVLGYGEISLVLAWPTGRPRVAAKRLPVFDDPGRATAYGAVITDYLDALRERGVEPVDTSVSVTPTGDGGRAVYVIQPVLEGDWLAPEVLRASDDDRGRALLVEIVDTIIGAVDERVGIDGQVSNWAVTPDGLRYLDVTTPFLTDADGASRLDLDVLTSSLPAALRPVIRRFVAPGVTARYHRAYDVVEDLAANLIKERLDRWIDPTVAVADGRLDRPLERRAVEHYYRSDARLWTAMLGLRRADRWWQRRVRRRPYPTLLPGPIDR